jgi:uncharacterized protein YlxW (UPF0749 family)
MKTLRVNALLFVMCTTCFAIAQPNPPSAGAAQEQNQMQTDAPADKIALQRRYDPMAGHAHLRGGIWDNALNGINPDDKNLGESVSKWRQLVVAETIHKVVFWTAVGCALSLLFALLFLYWLLHDRDRRVHISVNILTQIANAYIDARDRALDAIEKHNQLADDYNALAEKLASLERQKAENQRRIRSESQETVPDDLARGAGTSAEPSGALPETTAVEVQVRQVAEVQARQRLAHQISALQEKNKTLRTSLNEAVAQIEKLRRQPAVITEVP